MNMTPKKIWFIILFFMPSLAWSQANKGFKLLEDGDVNGAWALFQQAEQNEKEKPYAHFGMSHVLSKEGFLGFNLDSAYQHLLVAEKTYRKVDSKARDKWDYFSGAALGKHRRLIHDKVVEEIEAMGDVARIEAALQLYTRLSSTDKIKLIKKRNDMVWDKAEPHQLEDIFNRYGKDFRTHSSTLYAQLEKKIFEQEVGAKGWDRYPTFAEKYPAHTYVRNQLMEKSEEVKYSDDPKTFYTFLDKYGKTPFRERLLDSLASVVAHKGDLEDSRKYVAQYAKYKPSDEVWSHFYHLYKLQNFNPEGIGAFAKDYPEYPFPEQVQKDLDFFTGKRLEALTGAGFTPPAAQAFLQEHPDFPGVEELWEKHYKIYKAGNPTPAALDKFAEENPNFPFMERIEEDKKAIVSEASRKMLERENVSPIAYKKFLEKYPDTEFLEEFWQKIYATSVGEAPTLSRVEAFAKDNPDYPFKAELDSTIQQLTADKGANLLSDEAATAKERLLYIEKYPESTHVNDLWLKIYEDHKAKDPSISSIQRFFQQYPAFPFRDLIKEDIAGYEKNRFEGVKDLAGAYAVLKEFPDSEYKAGLEKKLFEMLKNAEEVKDLDKFLEHYPESAFEQEVLTIIYEKSTKDGSLESIKAFEQKYPKFKDKKRLEEDKKKITQADSIKAEAFINENAPKTNAYLALRDYIKGDLENKNWASAAEKVKTFEKAFGDKNKEYLSLLKIFQVQTENIKEPKSLSEVINSPGDEYSAIISADGATLLFCAKNREDNLGLEDIYISQKVNGEWAKPEVIKEVSTQNGYESPKGLSADGSSMTLFVDGSLCTSEKTADGWTPSKPLPSTINRSSWQSDANITADGKAMLFASEDGDFGSKDIYVSVKDEDGQWSRAINLGPVINTSKLERSPFLHPDMKTLYFSSRGHTGLGELDVFMSKRLNEKSWTEWSEPVNLGTAINTTGNDYGYKVSTDGDYTFFNVEGESGYDIYMAELPKAFQPEKVATVTGKLLSVSGKPLSADILWEDLDTKEVIQVSKSDPRTGDFFVTLPKKGQYGYSVKKEGYYPLSGNVDFKETVGDVKQKDMILATIEEMKKEDIRLPLNNLFFETGKFEIKPQSFPELDRLAQWITTYDLNIEIMGHTDSVGENTDNQNLSQNRARAVKTYLVNKGVDETRIVSTGFGESQPVAGNDTDEGRAQNRRVEIRIKK